MDTTHISSGDPRKNVYMLHFHKAVHVTMMGMTFYGPYVGFVENNFTIVNTT